MLSQIRWISLSAFLSFLSGLDSWINIIPELYCLSWHLTIFSACLYLSMPQWACKCSVLHRLDETKPSTRTCRNRHTFLHLLVLSTPSHVVLAINRATQQTIQNKERWFQKLVGTSPHFKITSSKLMKSSEISSVHFTSFTLCPSAHSFLWNKWKLMQFIKSFWCHFFLHYTVYSFVKRHPHWRKQCEVQIIQQAQKLKLM